MRTAALGSLAIGAVVLLGGCGTMFNLNLPENDPDRLVEPPRQVYGGLKLDAKVAPEYVRGVVQGREVSGKDFVRSTAALVDMPFSAVGDTVTLPMILLWQTTQNDAAAGRGDAAVSPRGTGVR